MKKIFIMMFGLLFVASAAFASPTAKDDMVTINYVDSQSLFIAVEILMVWYLLSHLKILSKIFSRRFGLFVLIMIFLRFVFNHDFDNEGVGSLVFLVDVLFLIFLSYIIFKIYKFKKETTLKTLSK